MTGSQCARRATVVDSPDGNFSVSCQVNREEDGDVSSPLGNDDRSESCSRPRPCPRVSLKGQMTADGYQPENWEWIDILTRRGGKGSNGRRVGRIPSAIPPALLIQAGHTPRQTRAIVSALGDEPFHHDLKRHKDLRNHCLECSGGSKRDVRGCAIINCPLWPYRMGRNPHNPRRGRNPFVLKPQNENDAGRQDLQGKPKCPDQ
jgi:hypothetical protein